MSRKSGSLAVLSAFFVVFVLSCQASLGASLCMDFDGGRNYFEEGIAVAGERSLPDTCIDEFTLVEKYCSGSEIRWEYYTCPIGCYGGACLTGGQGNSITGGIITAPGYGATFVSQNVPSTMNAGQQYAVSVTMRNAASNAWTLAASYSLGSQNPQDNSIWGLSRALLSPTDSIATGQSKDFTFTVTAPSTPGTYNFDWRMVRDGVMWFGDFTPNVAVSVIAATAYTCQAVGNLKPSGTASGASVNLEWSEVPGSAYYFVRVDDGVNSPVYDDTRFSGKCAPHYYCEDWIPASSVCSRGTCKITNIPVTAGRAYSYWTHAYVGTNICIPGSSAFTVTATQNCTDSDGGKDIYVLGSATGIGCTSESTASTCTYGMITADDTCVKSVGGNEYASTGPELIEQTCQGEKVIGQRASCPNGCSNGACAPPDTCLENTRCYVNEGMTKTLMTSSGKTYVFGLPKVYSTTQAMVTTNDGTSIVYKDVTSGNIYIITGLTFYIGDVFHFLTSAQQNQVAFVFRSGEHSCMDTDAGSSEIAGEAKTSSSGKFDYCDFSTGSNSILMEALCQGESPAFVKITCQGRSPYCNHGACNPSPPECRDTDQGRNPNVKGYLSESRIAGGPEHGDYCENLGTKQPWDNCQGSVCGVREYYCTGYQIAYEDIACPNGCSNGACLQPVPSGGISLRDAKYTAGSPGSDIFKITIVNGGGDIDLSNYQAIFTGNSYHIIIGNIQYQVRNLTGLGIIASGTSKEVQADSSQSFNPIISTSRCGTSIKVGLIKRGGTTQGDILVMQDMILSCTSVCINGETKQCGSPGLGACNKYGTSTCTNGNWGPCTGLMYPITEICDGIDNDCNGVVDDGNVCGGTQICTDSDGGKNYTVRGWVKECSCQSSSCLVRTCMLERYDGCLDNYNLSEGYCENNEEKRETVPCRFGCQEGACLQNPKPECVGEGSRGISWNVNDQCCSGLTRIDNSAPSADSCISPVDGSFICSYCGNGQCEQWENKCNCLQDCKAGTVSVNLKVNGADYPQSVQFNSPFVASWTSTSSSYCNAYGMFVPLEGGGNWTDLTNLPTSGSRTLYARHASLGYTSPLQIGIRCTNSQGVTAKDEVLVPVTQTQSCTEGSTCTIAEGQEFIAIVGGVTHNAKVIGVSSSTVAVISVDGVSKSVTKGSIYTISGVDVYIADIYAFAKETQLSQVSLVFSSGQACTDSDGGKDYYVKGTLTLNNVGGDNRFNDTCCAVAAECAGSGTPASSNGPYLREYYCLRSIQPSGEVYTCPNGCSNGACNTPNPRITSISRNPAGTQALPYLAGSTTTFSFTISDWSWVKQNVNLLSYKTQTTLVDGTTLVSTPAEGTFDMSIIDIIPFCQDASEDTGICTITGQYQSSQFDCQGKLSNSVRRRTEWLAINGRESSRSAFYFRCSDSTPASAPSPDPMSQLGQVIVNTFRVMARWVGLSN